MRRTPVETKCDSGHEQHICAMAQKKEFDKIKDVVTDPQFMCTNCGRVAQAPDNLCKPLPFSMIGPGIPLE